MLLLVVAEHVFANFRRRRFGEHVGPSCCRLRCTRGGLLFGLHAPILEPDLDLSLGEAESVSDLYATPPRQVAVVVELLLQFKRLVARVRLARPLRARHRICAREKEEKISIDERRGLIKSQ